MPVPESAIAKFREIDADAKAAFAGARDLHDSFMDAKTYAQDLEAAYTMGGVGRFSVPDVRGLHPEDQIHQHATRDIAAAKAEAARRADLAKRASVRAQELAGLRDACAAELRRRGVPETRLKPRTSI